LFGQNKNPSRYDIPLITLLIGWFGTLA